ncbi:MAG: hypothetical protein ACYC4S_05140 [Rhodoferax sp.]
MNISPFFRNLRSAYEAELEDLRFDSEGRDVLRQRLTQRRKELAFLLQMMALSPEMVAVVLHQGFTFKSPAMMEHLLSLAPEDFPDWDALADTVHLAPWANDLVQAIRKEPMGDWFLTVAAALEYMHHKPASAPARIHDPEDEVEEDLEPEMNPLDAEEENDHRNREEAGADWMVEQGFDRKS